MRKSNGFSEYKKLIIYKMEEHTKAINELVKSVKCLETEMAEFRGRAKVMSLFAGLLGGGVMSVIVSFVITALR